MNIENILLNNLVGKVKHYGIDMPASLNDAGQKIIYFTSTDNDITTVSMKSLMSHKLFNTFSKETQLKLNHWFNE